MEVTAKGTKNKQLKEVESGEREGVEAESRGAGGCCFSPSVPLSLLICSHTHLVGFFFFFLSKKQKGERKENMVGT